MAAAGGLGSQAARQMGPLQARRLPWGRWKGPRGEAWQAWLPRVVPEALAGAHRGRDAQQRHALDLAGAIGTVSSGHGGWASWAQG